MVSEVREVSGTPVSICRARIREAFGSPPTPDFHIQMISRGWSRADIDLGQGKFSVKGAPGRFIVTPANLQSEIEGDGVFELLSLSLPAEELCKAADITSVQLKDDLNGIFRGDRHDTYLHGLIESVWIEANNGSPNGRLYVDVAVRAIVSRLLDHSSILKQADNHIPALDVAALRRVTEILNDRFNQSISLDELANAAGVSSFYFSRLFKHAIGHPPYFYLTKIRIERSQELMRSVPDLPLASVASTCGFSDQAHFSRHFKKIVGVPPGRWRSEIA
ncbi:MULTISPECIES: helix-turn-helix domain-containing protein [Pirellulaceae]|nr:MULTISPECIES: AraC family transcriptional regulator [Pirellulaceae]